MPHSHTQTAAGVHPVAPDAPGAPLVSVAGPTGSGKSELALELAARFSGEIVNCDSLQVYRHFDIGSAKLPEAARRGVPHHLIDILDPGQIFTAGEYARLARETIADISAHGRLPIVAGGTGFYLRALLDGLFEGPSRDQSLRDRLAAREQRRRGSLHRLLSRFDSEAAAKIHPNDVPKVTRALEVCLLARRPVTELYRQGRDRLQGYRVLKFGLMPDREALNQRIDARCRGMFEGGLVEEVRAIQAMGYEAVKPFEALGYAQALQLIRGELNARDALFYAQRNTRRYAKRQITWLRREAAIEWLRGFGDDPEIQSQANRLVLEFLGLST
ncbi:MAG TPA: tRNA (adenosine(37)-N6)-dimethylallyltransferase MiaA [Bryobacteraceae bacterium]|nr:tRNA (adenosine(37)-N6)-dimethylallyltransferase MiaA [Bryobacteraceae bacterium]